MPDASRSQNALTAIAAARLLAERGFPIDAAIARGLASVRWPGRLERLQDRPAVYLDGTHNPAGARELVAFWEEHFPGRRIHLIYGAMRDKAVDEVAGLLFPAPRQSSSRNRPSRVRSPPKRWPRSRATSRRSRSRPDPGAALERALELAAPDDVVFAAGSLYLVGDLLRYWSSQRSVSEIDPAVAVSSVKRAK